MGRAKLHDSGGAPFTLSSMWIMLHGIVQQTREVMRATPKGRWSQMCRRCYQCPTYITQMFPFALLDFQLPDTPRDMSSPIPCPPLWKVACWEHWVNTHRIVLDQWIQKLGCVWVCVCMHPHKYTHTHKYHVLIALNLLCHLPAFLSLSPVLAK